MWIEQKNMFPSMSFFQPDLPAKGVLNNGPTVWLDEARPLTRYVFKHIKIKITESYINDIQFGAKTIQ